MALRVRTRLPSLFSYRCEPRSSTCSPWLAEFQGNEQVANDWNHPCIQFGARHKTFKPLPKGGKLRLEQPRTPAREIPRPSVLPINMNDAELDQLFASCIPRLQRTARLMLRDPQDSEDAVQEGLLLAFRNLKQFQGRSSFSTWLHSILRNVARTHYRRMKCRPKYSLEEELSDERGSKFEQHFLDPGLTPEQECELGERSRLLREIVQELPSGYAFAIQLCDVDGLEPRDASQILGISSCALKTCLFRARRIAARRLRARFCPPHSRYANQCALRLPASSWLPV
jgi:RNA polymerase sigma factor (sigma-70 family)